MIDVVAQDAEGEYMLIMIEDRPWGIDPNQPAQLREKINAYAAFIHEGELARLYPETVGQAVRIQLDCVEPPSGQFADLVDSAAGQLRQLGLDFRVNVQR